MIENFLQNGQWVILILSIMSLYLVSSVKHETRLNGYILTGVEGNAWANNKKELADITYEWKRVTK